MRSQTTLTSFLRGKIRVHQAEAGRRFTIDSVCLASFSWVREGERVLDLGTGTGILLLLLGHFHHPGHLVGVEVQPDLARLAALNLEENGWSGEGRIVAADVRDPRAFPEAGFDLVVSNPPYHEAERGLVSPDPGRATARHSLSAGYTEFLDAARRALAPGGRFCFVAPAGRLPEILGLAATRGLPPCLVRPLRSTVSDEPHLVLIQLRKAASAPFLTLPPMILRGEDGAYTPEVALWLGDAEPPGPRFICDVMVGKLARYLRLAGADAAYAREAEDDWLMDQARRSGRVLLTRDRPLLAECSRSGVSAFDPGHDDPKRQMELVSRAFARGGTLGDRPRCLDCNAPVLPVDRQEASGKVPRYTYLTHERFTACPCCGKLTWEGSHLERFRREVLRRDGSGNQVIG
jgi:tRNA1Val (adenine37-N6)-methyltransferase